MPGPRHEPARHGSSLVPRRAVALGATAVVPQVGNAASAPNRADHDRKVVLITGTSTGFGRLIALTLAREGYEVHASMRQLQHKNAAAGRELARIARRERLALELVEIDVRSERSVEEGVERVNRAVLPTMRDQRDGLVVQITSGVGRIAFPFQGAYNASKWAMEAMAQVSRYELSQSGVDVVIVEPGAYPTDLIDNARILYRDYVGRLSRRDARRRREYGELASRVENELREPPEPDPQEVADAVARLVRTPAGRRPLRTLVGADVEALGEINAVHQRIQDEIMGYAGYGDLIGVPVDT